MADETRQPPHGSKCTPEICDAIVEWAREGMTPAEWADEIGVSRPTLYYWRDHYDPFADAMERAQTALEAYYARAGREGMKRNAAAFNGAVWARMAASVAPQTFAERHINENRNDNRNSDADSPANLDDEALDARIAKLQEQRLHRAQTRAQVARARASRKADG